MDAAGSLHGLWGGGDGGGGKGGGEGGGDGGGGEGGPTLPSTTSTPSGVKSRLSSIALLRASSGTLESSVSTISAATEGVPLISRRLWSQPSSVTEMSDAGTVSPMIADSLPASNVVSKDAQAPSGAP